MSRPGSYQHGGMRSIYRSGARRPLRGFRLVRPAAETDQLHLLVGKPARRLAKHPDKLCSKLLRETGGAKQIPVVQPSHVAARVTAPRMRRSMAAATGTPPPYPARTSRSSRGLPPVDVAVAVGGGCVRVHT